MSAKSNATVGTTSFRNWSDPDDPSDPRVTGGEAWDELCRALSAAKRLVLGDGVPDTPRDQAEGFRYLARFLAAGTAQCVALADPDHPVFARMIDYSTIPWGLDCPDTLYLYAAVRGDARYRIWGSRGTANHIDIQVNYGHFSSGDIGSWGTISSLDSFDLEVGAEGEIEIALAPEAAPSSPPTMTSNPMAMTSNAMALAANAEFVLVRQYFDDWEVERPADLFIERLDAEWPIPPPRTNDVAARLGRLTDWIVKGGALWENMSRGLLSMEPNSLVVHLPEQSDARVGMKGQAYGMGNFRCGPDEAVIVEFAPPVCHHWSVSLANWYWESIEYASRQCSLNRSQATLDSDGRFRGVIAHRDPGVPNWLDTAGNARGTLAARFLRADAAPMPKITAVPFEKLRESLPPDTPAVTAAERAEHLTRRRHAVLRRFRW